MSNIKIENVEVYGFQHALRSMRNAKDSWHLNDSVFWGDRPNLFPGITVPENPVIGPNDLKLLSGLVKAGQGHQKLLRTIEVWLDISLPRYVFTELDTAKVGTVRQSCSTMYKLGHRDLTPEDFAQPEDNQEFEWLMDNIIKLNTLGALYRESNKKNKKLLKRAKRNLPEGYIQKAGYHINYEALLNMFFQRRYHELEEWRLTDGSKEESICNWIKSLPYMAQIIEVKEKKNGSV